MSDTLSWATAIDTTGFEDGINKIEDGIKNAAADIEGQSERIQALFSDIPEIDIKAVTNMPQTADDIRAAYAQIDNVISTNAEAVSQLKQEYGKLELQIKEYNKTPGKSGEVAKLREEQTAIKENIKLRQDMNRKVIELEQTVKQHEATLKNEISTQKSVKTQIKEVMAEMANMRNEAQKQGITIDESTGRYRELAEELGRLKDIQGDVATQAKILSNDEGQFQGVISGLSGLSGAFTATQGAMALFGAENENVQAIMMKLQAAMSITMGLQQLQQMLNKDSAFQLVTLNSLRQLWNKLTGESNAVQAKENIEKTKGIAVTREQAAATTQNTVATNESTIAEEMNTVAQTENTVATGEDTLAKEAKTVASGEAAVAEGTDTVATTANAAAATAGAAANFTLAGAFRAVAAAIKSIPLFGWIAAAIGGIIAIVSALNKKTDEETEAMERARKKTEELRQTQERFKQSFASTAADLIMKYEELRKSWNNLKTEQEKAQFIKDRATDFDLLGMSVTDVKAAEDYLAGNTDKIVAALKARAMAIAAQEFQQQAYKKYLEKMYDIDNTVAGGGYYYTQSYKGPMSVGTYQGTQYNYDTVVKRYGLKEGEDYTKRELGYNTMYDLNQNAVNKINKALNEAAAADARERRAKNRQEAEAEWKKIQDFTEKEIKKQQSIIDDAKLTFDSGKKNNYGSSYKPGSAGHTGSGSGKGGGSTSTAQQLIARDKEAFAQWKEAVKQYLRDAYSEIEDAEIDAMEDSLAKEIRQIEFQTQERSQAWEDSFLELAAMFKEYDKQVYLSKKGNTEEGWEKSERGQMSLEKYRDEILADEEYAELAKEYNERLNQIEELGKEKIKKTKQKYADEWIEEYGNDLQREELMTRQWNERLERIAKEAPQALPGAIAQMKQEFSQMSFDKIQRELRWDKIFQNLDSMSAEGIDKVIAKFNTFKDTIYETFDPDAISKFNDALGRLEKAKALASTNIWSAFIPDEIQEQMQNEQELIRLKGIYNDLLEKQKNKEQEVNDKVKEIIAELKKLTGVDYKIDDIADPQRLQQIIDALNGSNSDGAATIQGMANQLSGMQTELGGITEAAGDAVEAIQGMEGASGGAANTIAMVGVIVHKINESVQAAAALIHDLADTADALGADTEVGSGWDTATTLMDGFAEASQGATDAFEAFKSGNPIGVIQGVVKSFTAWIRAFAAIHDAKHEREIIRIQEQIDDLSDAYDRLSRQIDKAFSYDASRLIDQQTEMLEQQKQLIRLQIEEEKAKKNTDWDKVKDWEKALKDLDEQIEDSKAAAIDAIFGEDLRSAIENFADAYADAWANGEDRAKSARDTVKAMMQNMVKESIKAAIQSSAKMEEIRQKLAEFYSDGILTEWEQNYVYNMAEELQKELDEQFGWADKLLDNDADREGTSRGIATASQDSVDENNARLTTIQGHTYTLVQGMQMLNSTANVILERVTGIEENTSEAADRLNEIDKNTKRTVEALETIQTTGLRLK